METGVPVWLVPQFAPVQIHCCVPVDSVKLNADAFASPLRRHAKCLAIPPRPRWEITALRARRVVLVDPPLDAPIVRKVHSAPVRIVKQAGLGAAGVAEEEFPVRIRSQFEPGFLRLRRRDRSRQKQRRHGEGGKCAVGRQFHEGLFLLWKSRKTDRDPLCPVASSWSVWLRGLAAFALLRCGRLGVRVARGVSVARNPNKMMRIVSRNRLSIGFPYSNSTRFPNDASRRCAPITALITACIVKSGSRSGR